MMMNPQYKSMKDQDELASCLKQRLDTYTPELNACIYLFDIRREDVEQVKFRTEQFLKDLNRILLEWQ